MPTVATIPTSVPDQLTISGIQQPAEWTKPQLWYPHDYAEFVRDVVVLWPEIGDKCEIVVECVQLESMVVVSTFGFWIVEMSLERAGYVAFTWEETCPLIQTKHSWALITFKEPTKENIEKRRVAEAQRYHEPMTREEKTEVDEVLEMAYARWSRLSAGN